MLSTCQQTASNLQMMSNSLSVSVRWLLLRWAPWALESGPSERQHLLGVGREDYQRCFASRHRCWGISAADLVFAAPPCTAGTLGRLPDLVGGRTPCGAVCVLLVDGLG